MLSSKGRIGNTVFAVKQHASLPVRKRAGTRPGLTGASSEIGRVKMKREETLIDVEKRMKKMMKKICNEKCEEKTVFSFL
ncbi:MAG: hypothetical protein J5569_01075 [Oscillospiraceae bacterium]|nr:hypothetical protein [Oscillospiraceae bacterium]